MEVLLSRAQPGLILVLRCTLLAPSYPLAARTKRIQGAIGGLGCNIRRFLEDEHKPGWLWPGTAVDIHNLRVTELQGVHCGFSARQGNGVSTENQFNSSGRLDPCSELLRVVPSGCNSRPGVTGMLGSSSMFRFRSCRPTEQRGSLPGNWLVALGPR